MTTQIVNEQPLSGSHPVIMNAVFNLRQMIETDIKKLTHSIGRKPNEREESAFVEKAIKAVCGTLTRAEGNFFLAVVGARQS